MPYELWLSIRYLLARRRERFISIIAVLSIGGVALGVMALLLVLAVMSGFDYDMKQKLVGMNAHLTVESVRELHDAEPLIKTITAIPHVVGASPFVSGQAILRLPDRAFGVLVKGIDAARDPSVSQLSRYVVKGNLPASNDQVVIGSELADATGAKVGGALDVISPADGSLHSMIISGIFRSGMYEYDATLIAVTIPQAQKLFGLTGSITGVGVRIDSFERAFEIKHRLSTRLGGEYVVKTWMEQNQTLFDALRLEKITMFVILTLIVLVAAVNIVSTLIMMVTEKTRDIGILKSVGASSRSIGWIFTWQGVLIGGLGTLFGFAAACGIIWLQRTYEIVRLPNTVYYLDHLPVRIEPFDWAVTLVASLFITLVATIYPAWQASRLSPVDALRYE